MRKTKNKKPSRKAPEPSPPPEPEASPFDDQILSSNLTLHELFQRQTATILDRADLSDEERQSILIGMSCPCCGGGGFSFTAKLKRGS
jgi:hypothetical protein